MALKGNEFPATKYQYISFDISRFSEYLTVTSQHNTVEYFSCSVADLN